MSSIPTERVVYPDQRVVYPDRGWPEVAVGRRDAADRRHIRRRLRRRRARSWSWTDGTELVRTVAAMTAPRQLLPGATYLVTRRTERRHLLFRPDGPMNRLFRYCLAIAAEENGIVVHGVVLMSDRSYYPTFSNA